MIKKGGEKIIIGRKPKFEMNHRYMNTGINKTAQKVIDERDKQIERITKFIEIVETENVKLKDEKQILLEEIRRLKNGRN